MRKLAILAAASLGLLLASPGASDAQQSSQAPRPISGPVTEIDQAARTLVLGGETYHVPANVFDLSRLEPGAAVILHWKRSGNRMVATQIETNASDG